MRLHILIGALCALALSGTSGSAVPLNPGGVIFPTGTTFATNPALGGVVQNDNLIDFDFDPTPTTPFTNVGGEVQNRVVVNTDGDLIFSQRIRNVFNIDGGTFAILGYSLTGYAGFSVDADFRTDGLGDRGFSSVSRSVDGDLMTFRYDDPLVADSIIPPGLREESLFPSLLTDAQDFELTGRMRIFGEILPLGGRSASGIASNLFTIDIGGIAVPVPTVPEVPLPAGGVLLLSGFGLMAAFRRKAARKG